MPQPDVSVIIPTYNRKEYLKQAISSCFKGNEKINVEVIVIDDGSTDGTHDYLKCIKDKRIRTVFQENHGEQIARNKGLKKARGKYIKFLDDDDFIYQGVLYEQWEKLKKTNAEVCYGPIDITDGKNIVKKHFENPITSNLMEGIASHKIKTYPHVFMYERNLVKKEIWRTNIKHNQDEVHALDISTHMPSICRNNSCIGISRKHEGPRVSKNNKETHISEKAKLRFNYLLSTYNKRIKNTNDEGNIRKGVSYGLWTHAYMIAPFNFSLFRLFYNIIKKYFPEFKPPRSSKVLTIMDRKLGVVITQRIINFLRIIKFCLKR